MRTYSLLLVIGFSITKGAIVLPCGNNLTDVPYGQKTVFTCNTEGQLQWHVEFGNSQKFELLAQCELDSCYTSTNFSGLFVAQVIGGQRIMTVGPANDTKLWRTVQLVNGSLACRDTTRSTTVGRCHLNLVYLPEEVSCRAVNTFWSVKVSCAIGKVFSSRGPYRCELFRLKDGSDKERLETISMTTSPTSENITRDAVKMSGACHFTSTIPKEEGNYSFVVSVLPMKLSYLAKFSEERMWYLTERPSPPRLSCWPSPCVLGHTVIVKCACTAQHPGQPAGHLQLLMGNGTLVAMLTSSEEENGQLRELHHTLALGAADDNQTWFRCDVVWGTEVIVGEDYTANIRSREKSLEYATTRKVTTVYVSYDQAEDAVRNLHT